MFKKVLKIFLKVCLIIFLTVITQIGGIIYVASIFLKKKIKQEFKFKGLATFVALYLIATFLIVPFIAPLFGRERVIHTDKIYVTNYMTVILNRNYVRPKLNELLRNAEKQLDGFNIEISYLDANFPFIDKFPLLPHLSHNDGKKLDLNFIYEDANGQTTNRQKSMSGYGVFEAPSKGEYDQISVCKNKGFWQYDFNKYVTYGKINNDLFFSEHGTKKLIQSLLSSPDLGKLFIEPHLKTRLNLTDSRVRYHGCRAVRHDDHIHIQLK